MTNKKNKALLSLIFFLSINTFSTKCHSPTLAILKFAKESRLAAAAKNTQFTTIERVNLCLSAVIYSAFFGCIYFKSPATPSKNHTLYCTAATGITYFIHDWIYPPKEQLSPKKANLLLFNNLLSSALLVSTVDIVTNN